MAFIPNLSTLPAAQRKLWPELAATPESFTLYDGTALALRLGHRTSIDFHFFSNHPFDPGQLTRAVPYPADAERIQAAPNTLTCRVERGGPVLVSFFGALGLGHVAAAEQMAEMSLNVASLPDLAGAKAALVQKRAELAAGEVIYGKRFNPLITMKALAFFDDVPGLPADVKERLSQCGSSAMKPFPETPELLAVAERVVWFKPPADPIHFWPTS